jgi:hypothetical protein
MLGLRGHVVSKSRGDSSGSARCAPTGRTGAPTATMPTMSSTTRTSPRHALWVSEYICSGHLNRGDVLLAAGVREKRLEGGHEAATVERLERAVQQPTRFDEVVVSRRPWLSFRPASELAQLGLDPNKRQRAKRFKCSPQNRARRAAQRPTRRRTTKLDR